MNNVSRWRLSRFSFALSLPVRNLWVPRRGAPSCSRSTARAAYREPVLQRFAVSLGVLALCWLVGCEEKKAPTPTPPSPTTAQAPVPPTPSVAEEAEEPEQEAEPEEIAAQHILIAYRGAERAPRSVKRSKAEAQKLAAEVLAKARAKEKKFEELAMEYSDDDSKLNRGSLGKFKKDKMVPEFSESAFKLKVNEVSEVVETKFGFHIIKRNQ